MKIKNIIFTVVIFIISTFFIIFDHSRFDLTIKINSFVVGNFVLLVYFLFGVTGILSLIHAIKYIKSLKWQAVIPVVIFSITIFYVFVFPLTDLYYNISYKINAVKRTQIVEMLWQNKLDRYQIGANEYMVPFRSCSYTGTMLVQKKADNIKVMFYINYFFGKSKVLIYVSDDSGIDKNDFNGGLQYNLHFSDIKKVDFDWYTATICP
jgi:hypothetical protein